MDKKIGNTFFNKFYKRTRKELNAPTADGTSLPTTSSSPTPKRSISSHDSGESSNSFIQDTDLRPVQSLEYIPKDNKHDMSPTETEEPLERIPEENIYHVNSEVDTSSSDDDGELFPEIETQTLHRVQGSPKSLNLQLGQWAVDHNVTQTALTNLLHILKPLHPELPLDARTLLNTPRVVPLKVIEPGVYYHFGFKNCIEKLIESAQHEIKTSGVIEVCLNIDGLPLSKSSGSQLYPILCNMFKQKNPVCVVGVYHGNEKPKHVNEFLDSFVSEASDIVRQEFIFNGKSYIIKIKGFICDAPAKCFIKCIRGHTGYKSCTKCLAIGSYISNRVCFPETDDLILRTDLTFRNKSQEEHHTGTSVLELIPNIDMINDFPLDYMHLICLGVVKKLLVSLWIEGKPGTKLSAHQVSVLSGFILNHTSQIPVEFSRKGRSLTEVKRWKATEFRLFLLYLGPLVLRSILSPENYTHFLTLHVAITILSTNRFLHQIDYAESLLKYFVTMFSSLYGVEYISHNIHNLLHLCEDVRRYGPIDMFSAFPFENHMQTLKKMVRKGDRPLEQIVRRIHERDYILISSEEKYSQQPQLMKKHSSGPVLLNMNSLLQYKTIKFPNFLLSISEPDNCCCLHNDILIIVRNFVSDDNMVNIIGQQFLEKKNLYSSPCNSSKLGIFICSSLSSLDSWPLSTVRYKCVKLNTNHSSEYVVYPLLHLEY